MKMPRGIKRSHDGNTAPTVGDEKLNSKRGKNSVRSKPDAMSPGDKGSPGKRVSKRVVKAKRQIDFVCDLNEEKELKGSMNNNAKPVVSERGKRTET